MNIEADAIEDVNKISETMQNRICIQEIDDAYIGKAMVFEEVVE